MYQKMPNHRWNLSDFISQPKASNLGEYHADKKFNWFVLSSPAGGPADEQTFVSEAIYAVAVRPRFLPSFGRLRNVVRSGRIWLPLFQPELVCRAQERREDHRAGWWMPSSLTIR